MQAMWRRVLIVLNRQNTADVVKGLARCFRAPCASWWTFAVVSVGIAAAVAAVGQVSLPARGQEVESGASIHSPDEWRVAPEVLLLDESDTTPGSVVLTKSLRDAAEYVLRWKLPGDAEA